MHCFVFRKPGSGEAAKKPPSRPSNAAQEKPVDKKKEPDARERRRKDMMQNQVRLNIVLDLEMWYPTIT